ncbi:CGNR zinc finger domain-containing protein [Actinomadura madurae]|uniref:CGNR zinc finger domain-containing protein n=1 Tax=Actinomadura madurae TaxID=1993 RepID=UPI0020D1F5ED|nr:CGNR zinc finger domain-containing protein [Actinomadura madurae]MCP9947621.1 CGNR zinc finger domain-containing protein [Actinomadura madurae]MCP9964387.1 CGNR zinc finger domain-containing protein [Actinomadura madurae]MCP9976869.1 CGNR zinc finger domain-containing protein [Actinomadura madurae]MCQ0011639.1 CGNR zinc finger domain-containing protein [Actinomadura madurae]MCQ0013052.1 CGNR zinc finger domain-containing protein [Actinomadura madurae]
MRAGFPDFRLGSVLATSFTGTLTERNGTPVERIPTPQRLVDWLAVNDLAVDSCTTAQLERARELREAIHAAATAAALQNALPVSAIQIINDCSVQGRAAAILTPEGNRQWRFGSDSCVEDALSVIAVDAISILAGERDGKLALCASPTCRAAFFDTSQSRTRKWCEMNTCGNRQKKARFHANHRKNEKATPTGVI